MSAPALAPAGPAPAAQAPGPLPRPDVAERVLPGGARLVSVRRDSAAPVEVRLAVPFAGAGATHPALAELVAATLLAPAPGCGADAVDDALADLGAVLRAQVGPSWLRVQGHVPADGLPGLLAVLAGALADPQRDAAAVRAARDRLRQRLRLAAADPRVAARCALLSHLFGTHPVAREIAEDGHVAAATDAEIAALHAAAVRPDGATLILVGAVDHDAVAALAVTRLAAWPPVGTVRRQTAPPPRTDRPLARVPRPGARQAGVRLAARSLPHTDPGHVAAYLAEQVLGGSFTGRLMASLREEHGYIYTGGSAIEEHAGHAVSVIQFGAAPERVDAAVAQARQELDRLARTAPASDAEIDAARAHCRGLHTLATASNAGQADVQYQLAIGGRAPDWLAAHHRRVAAVPHDAVRSAAADLHRPERYTGVLLVPEESA